jgi:HlyD family secretion protein
MKKTILIIVGIVALGAGGWYYTTQNQTQVAEVEYRYAAVEKGTLRRSISASGQVVALTAVDVKSKAGGNVVKLAVEEGSIVKQGDLIAIIDPEDTKAVYDQASADLESANARARQAEITLELQIKQSETAVQDARNSLAAAKTRLERSTIEASRQPELSSAAVRTAQANLEASLAALERLQKVDIPQQRADAQNGVTDTQTSVNTAEAELTRQQSLLQQGYVAASAVDNARRTLATAKSNLASATQRLKTIDDSARIQIASANAEIARTRAALSQAKANSTQDAVLKTNLAEAKQAVRSAEIALQIAQDNREQVAIRRSELIGAKASTVRSRVSERNAKINLESTTVVAPRDGVVTVKYLEEGTIIPPGASTFAQGTSLVQISDVTELYVECAVDEADVAAVKVGQKVSVTTEGFPNQKLEGKVTRVNPAATTVNNITAVKVRVKISADNKVPVVPGMNATCEFITMELNDVLVAPSQAVTAGEDGKSTVRVKSADPKKPEVRTVEIGEAGNEGIEIKSGLKVGEEVVTAEIDVAELREIQRKMKEAQEGGGLAGGGGRPNQNRPRATTGGGAGAGGGARPR